MRIISSIFSTFFRLIAVFILLGGMLALGLAATTLFRYHISYSTSAVQLTQVYSEGIFHALLAIGMFILAALLLAALNTTTRDLQRSLKNIERKTVEMNEHLLQLNQFLVRQQGEALKRPYIQR